MENTVKGSKRGAIGPGPDNHPGRDCAARDPPDRTAVPRKGMRKGRTVSAPRPGHGATRSMRAIESRSLKPILY